MKIHQDIKVKDSLSLSIGPDERILKDLPNDIEIKNNLKLVCYERGKVVSGSSRSYHNIFVNSGREWLSQLMSYSQYGPDIAARNDRIRYVGFGTGTQPEVATITSLITPIAYNTGSSFLAQLNIPTYPLNPLKTTVQYTRLFDLLELSVTGDVSLAEVGLFTDGSNGVGTPGLRDITLTNASLQSPVAYKSFTPLTKTQNYQLSLQWSLSVS